MLLHSNLPGEINFGRTARVSWELVQVVDEESKRRDRSVHCSEGYDAVAAFLSRGGSAAVTLPTPARSDGVKDHKSKFESAAADTKDTAATTRRIERPMVLDRAADSDDGVVNGKQTGESTPGATATVAVMWRMMMISLLTRSIRVVERVIWGNRDLWASWYRV